jgi:hypothetical protein
VARANAQRRDEVAALETRAQVLPERGTPSLVRFQTCGERVEVLGARAG